MLQVKNLSGGYQNNHTFINDIDFALEAGESLAILGQNGSGKSTLAKAIFNILPFKTGNVSFNDENISNLNTSQLTNKGVYYMLQGGKVFPNLTVKENLEFAKKDRNLTSSMIPENLQNNKHTKAGFLSGGQKHQLALAMVLINTPKLVILDEPSSGLVNIARQELYAALQAYKQQHDCNILLIEQNINEAVRFCDKLLLLKNGKTDPPEQIENPKATLKILQEQFFN